MGIWDCYEIGICNDSTSVCDPPMCSITVTGLLDWSIENVESIDLRQDSVKIHNH